MWAPVFNSFKFVNQAAPGFLDSFLQSDYSALPFMEGAGYCQKVNTGEVRQIQWHTDTALDVVTLKVFETGATVTTFATTQVGVGSKRDSNGDSVPFEYYQSDIAFTTAGNYYLEISDGSETLRSEPIQVGTFTDTVLMEFTNWTDTDLNIWANGFTPAIRAEAQLFKRLPSSINKSLNSTENITTVTSQRQTRGILMELYQLPMYMHEQLAYGWSLSRILIDGQPFYSEEGYNEPTYWDRYNLANSSININARTAFIQYIPQL